MERKKIVEQKLYKLDCWMQYFACRYVECNGAYEQGGEADGTSYSFVD